MSRFLLVVMILASMASAIGVVYARHRHRLLFVELAKLEKVRDELNIEFGRLQLEQATVAESNRIDQIARMRLGMKFPEAGDVVVVRQ
ncbi:cell division protein FtsL [Pseudoxanthomonas yeongjuensis]|jgi:cell division protein FtsL|uniref:cell division protein FtsL n=1 Tax=Pseudoxanthomonas yeongjuensis TaxID=377616 RepID=UPI001391B86C|nr:cell division protein FtsL [Pseudoxanthomonas yeongjuensis]KAF1714213.1 cell division protein FtsL [Pseudoxanthomonas yeongjuensis]